MREKIEKNKVYRIQDGKAVEGEATDVNERVVNTLKRLLEQAENGEIQDLAVIWRGEDGQCIWRFEGPTLASYKMLGAMDNMRHRLNDIINTIQDQDGSNTHIEHD